MCRFLVIRAICKALLLMLSGANVVHFIDVRIRKRLIFSFLRIVLGDPFGINPNNADICCYVLEARHLRESYFLTLMSTSNCFINIIDCKNRYFFFYFAKHFSKYFVYGITNESSDDVFGCPASCSTTLGFSSPFSCITARSKPSSST